MPAKSNPFAAAAKKADAPIEPGKKKQNIFKVQEPEVNSAIAEFIEASGAEKQAKADKEMAAATVKPFCRREWLSQFAVTGRKPDTLKFRTDDDEMVTFIVQDRGERYGVSDGQMETLKALLGPKKLKGIVVDEMVFKFNNEILNKPGVMNALGAKIAQLVKDDSLSEAEAADLLVAEPRTTVLKGSLDSLSDLCGGDVDKMEAVMEALGSHVSHYIKA